LAYDAADPDGSRRLCADAPVFVFDPSNDSNRPVPGMHDAILNFWPIYPQAFRDLFIRSFTHGLSDPDARVMENQWRKELCPTRDAIFYCPRRTAENVLDIDRIKRKTDLDPCWSCQDRLHAPARMRVGGPHDPHLFVLSAGAQLFAHHLGGDT
jgi:hypothetical protein